MTKHRATHFWVLSGPVCLVVSFSLLVFRAAPFMGCPVWLCGLCTVVVIASFTAYLGYREIVARQGYLQDLQRAHEKECDSLREALDEAGSLRREKVDALDEAMRELKEQCFELRRACLAERSRATALEVSLHDALDELRGLRQLNFLKAESGAALPPDLPKRYHQLTEQFNEKTLVLSQTRRRLFTIEGQLFSAGKIEAEKGISSLEEVELLCHELTVLDRENKQLEDEICCLEGLITELIRGKVAKSAPSKKRTDGVLEFQFDTV